MGRCHNEIIVPASIGRVWKIVQDFHDMSWAPNVITSLTPVGNKAGREIGARRILNDLFHETLTELDPVHHTFSYTIDDGPGPVARGAVKKYEDRVTLEPVEGGTRVIWESRFRSADEAAVQALCNPIYRALLEDLNQALSAD